MKYYKSVEILTNFQYQASLHKRKDPPSKHFLATVLGGLIITAYTNAYLFCPPSSCTYNSHINTVKTKVFLRTLCSFSSLVWASSASVKLSTQVSVIPAAHLCSTAIRRDSHAAIFVNCPIVALSVFYFTL